MAKLPEPTNAGGVFADRLGEDLAPPGTFTATIIDIDDSFGVERRKYQSEETEIVDLTTFLFGFRDRQQNKHLIATAPMKISGHSKSKLVEVLRSITGSRPASGWDYCTLKGKQCLITIEHVQSQSGDRTYANIISYSPLPESGEVAVPAPAPVAAPAPAPAPVAAAVEDDENIPF